MAFGVVEKAAFLLLCAPLAALMLWELRERRKQCCSWPRRAWCAGGRRQRRAVPQVLRRQLVHALRRRALPAGAGRRPRASRGSAASWAATTPSRGRRGRRSLEAASAASCSTASSPLGYYFVGRYTGDADHGAARAAAARGAARHAAEGRTAGRWRRCSGCSSTSASTSIVFPKNYYGGGQSLGDRYFIQMAPAILVAALFVAAGGARSCSWPVGRRRRRCRCCSRCRSTSTRRAPNRDDPRPARRSGCCRSRRTRTTRTS